MSTKQKWFYPLQNKAKQYLDNNYNVICCNSQNVYPEQVYECFTCTDRAGKTIQVLVFMNKRDQIAIYEMAAMFHI
jgi:hypothetical protein